MNISYNQKNIINPKFFSDMNLKKGVDDLFMIIFKRIWAVFWYFLKDLAYLLMILFKNYSISLFTNVLKK